MPVSGNTNTVSALSAQIEANTLSRTLSGIVRSELPTIEDALRHGLRYEQLCQHLAALGVTVSPGTLRQTVYRLRQQRQGSDESNPASSQQIPDPAQIPAPATAPPSLPPPLPPVKSPVAAGPTPDDLAVGDKVPLLEVKPPATVGFAPPTDFITAIRQSCPDLDVLAYRYRQSQQRGGGSQSFDTPSIKPATAAEHTPSSPSPGNSSP